MWKPKQIHHNPFIFQNEGISYIYSSFFMPQNEIEELKNISDFKLDYSYLDNQVKIILPGILSCNIKQENALKFTDINISDAGNIEKILLKIKLDKTGLDLCHQTGMLL